LPVRPVRLGAVRLVRLVRLVSRLGAVRLVRLGAVRVVRLGAVSGWASRRRTGGSGSSVVGIFPNR
jgi:hypothetical protein